MAMGSPYKRRIWGRIRSWWKGKRKDYHAVAADSGESTDGPIRCLMRQNISTDTPDEVIFEVMPEAAPNLPHSPFPKSSSPQVIWAVPAVPSSPAMPETPLWHRPRPLERPSMIPFEKIPSFSPPPRSSLSIPNTFTRRRTKDSFQGSLESIDSLMESYWDPEEDASLVTPVATNIVQSVDFLEEHVDFLLVQTQPRSVEVVWEMDEWNEKDLPKEEQDLQLHQMDPYILKD